MKITKLWRGLMALGTLALATSAMSGCGGGGSVRAPNLPVGEVALINFSSARGTNAETSRFLGDKDSQYSYAYLNEFNGRNFLYVYTENLLGNRSFEIELYDLTGPADADRAFPLGSYPAGPYDTPGDNYLYYSDSSRSLSGNWISSGGRIEVVSIAYPTLLTPGSVTLRFTEIPMVPYTDSPGDATGTFRVAGTIRVPITNDYRSHSTSAASRPERSPGVSDITSAKKATR